MLSFSKGKTDNHNFLKKKSAIKTRGTLNNFFYYLFRNEQCSFESIENIWASCP